MKDETSDMSDAETVSMLEDLADSAPDEIKAEFNGGHRRCERRQHGRAGRLLTWKCLIDSEELREADGLTCQDSDRRPREGAPNAFEKHPEVHREGVRRRPVVSTSSSRPRLD